MRRSFGKPDAAQPGIVSALRKAGAHVVILSGVAGCCDLMAFRAARIVLFEVKSNPAAVKRKSLTATRQAEFRSRAAEHGVIVHVVTTPEEALAAIGAVDPGRAAVRAALAEGRVTKADVEICADILHRARTGE